MNKAVNILFLGGAKRVSLAERLIEAGRERGEHVRIYSYELTREVPIACVGEVIIGRKWKESTLYDHLSAVIREKEIQIILPFVDPAIEVASRLKELHPTLFVPCSPMETCWAMFDKQLSNDWFVRHHIPVPVSYSVPSSDPVPSSHSVSSSHQSAEALHFPVILKPRTGSASKGIKIVQRADQWEEVLTPDASRTSDTHLTLDDYLIQEYIVLNEEYTVDCYVSQAGTVMSIVPRIRLETAGGEVMNTRTVRDAVLIELSNRILATGAFRGPVTIQFIRDLKNGATYVMEINPRLGGGVIASIAAGADIPAFLLAECGGEALQPVDDWKENTLMTRYFKEVLFYADNH